MAYIKGVTTLLFLLTVPAWSSSKQERHANPFVLRNQIYQIERAELNRRALTNLDKYVPDYNIGPKRHKDYNPSLGYEVYWEEGIWVYSTSKPEEGDLCGDLCTPIYKNYGYICGRDGEFKHRTFENYCEMRSIDCDDIYKWRIAYRGKCQGELKVFPTLSKQVVTRAMQWGDEFSKRYDITANG